MDGSAVFLALSNDELARPAAAWLLGFPSLLKALSFALPAAQAVGAVLLFTPIGTPVVRLTLVSAFVLMQLGFGSCLDLGLFPWVGALALVPFLPSELFGFTGRDTEGHARAPLRADAAVALLLACVVWWNVSTLLHGRARMPAPARRLVELARLEQYWFMFAPSPPRTSGWYVMPGTLQDGRRVDLFRAGDPPNWKRPADARYANTRWQKYLMNLRRPEGEAYRPLLASYLCREWNASHSAGSRLGELEIQFMERDLAARTPARLVRFGRFPCSD